MKAIGFFMLAVTLVSAYFMGGIIGVVAMVGFMGSLILWAKPSEKRHK